MRKKKETPLIIPNKEIKSSQRRKRKRVFIIIRTREKAAEHRNEANPIIEKFKTDNKSDVCLKWSVFKGNEKRNTQRNEALYFRTRSFAARVSDLMCAYRSPVGVDSSPLNPPRGTYFFSST